MPYVKKTHRLKLDPAINDFSTELASSSASFDVPQQIGELYFVRFLEVVSSVKQLALGETSLISQSASTKNLTSAIMGAGVEDGGFWAGDLNYALTRIIQIVPRRLVEQKKWDKEFRYWVYAATAGALERTALSLNSNLNKDGHNSWIDTVLIGVLFDVKDEYKRRVNAPYEDEQIVLSGDAYDVTL